MNTLFLVHLWAAGIAAALSFVACMCDPRLSFSERTSIEGLAFGSVVVLVFGVAAAVLLETLMQVTRIICRIKTFCC